VLVAEPHFTGVDCPSTTSGSIGIVGSRCMWCLIGCLRCRGSRCSITGVDVSYAAPQAHEIVNIALHREYYPSIVFIFSQWRKDLYDV
jgi:hypothetical protein